MLKRLFKHRHKWQERGINRYGKTTYRMCLKCRDRQQWIGGINGHFEECKPIPRLDSQFDENDKFIF